MSLSLRWNLFLTALFFTIFFRIPSFGNTYYVAKNGNDSNPGGESEPWLTIQRAANTLVSGDSVFIRAGIYNERVLPQNSGIAGNDITYIASPGDTATIDGTGISVPLWAGLFHVQEKGYITISGIRIANSADAGIFADLSSHLTIEKNTTTNTVSSGIGVWGCDHVVIDDNEVELACNDGAQECISVAITDSFVVKNNYVHDGGPGTVGGEGIDIKNGSSNGVVYNNIVRNTSRVGIYVDAWDKHTYNIEVFQNIVHDCGADGMDVASEVGGLLENVKIYNNIVFNNRWVGITIANWGEPAPQRPMDNIQILNNTFYNNGISWGGGIEVENPDAKNVLIRNNIFSQNLSFQILFDGVPPESATVDHNLVDGFRNIPGEIYGNDSIVGDPQFTDPRGADFHLQGSSPAVDAGSSLDAPSFDFDGNPRPQGVGVDIGAYEFVITGIEEWGETQMPIVLDQNFPNPFDRWTVFRYHLLLSGEISLTIYDLSGKVVVTLVNGIQDAGDYQMEWGGLDDHGQQVPSGIYFSRIQSGTGKEVKPILSRKLILLR